LRNPELYREPQTEEEHIEPGYVGSYGNLAYCSKASIREEKLSRKDDLQSLVYLMANLRSDKILFEDPSLIGNAMMTKFKQEKLRQQPEEFCANSDCAFLLEFAKEAFAIKFTEKPDYGKLRWLLKMPLLCCNRVPDNRMDWTGNNVINEPVVEIIELPTDSETEEHPNLFNPVNACFYKTMKEKTKL